MRSRRRPGSETGTEDLVEKPRRAPRRVWMILPLLGLSLLGAAPAGADPEPPSEREVERSKEQARERAAAVEDIQAKLEKSRTRLKTLSAKVRRLAREYYRQQVRLERARRQYEEAQQRLAGAEQAVRRARDRVAELAAQRYRTGGVRRIGALLGADGPQDLIDRMNTLQLLARQRGARLDRMRSARIVADVLREQAREALAERRKATRRVARAKQAAQRTATRQRAEVERIRRLEAKLGQRLNQAQSRASRLAREREDYLERLRQQRAARRKARQQASTQKQAQDPAQQATEEVAEITGNADCDDKPVSLGSYSNGLIPPQALCPLPQDGHLLRADAAAAFVRLNAAYADAFGEPICITDSYRSLAVQQHLAERKPELAAEPGTSNHGWGIAVDLCGGINSYGTATHEWMRAHAPEFGWVLPAWARAGGSMPEPWHWEYTG